MPPTVVSIHASRPRERGGIVARRGFAYQDHVAVAFYLQMLVDPELAWVWCEAEDDITLIWDRGSGESLEFVQVKHDQLNQLWTAALMCESDGASLPGPGGSPASLLEKSLAHDRFTEPCTFRIVTSWQLTRDFVILTWPLAHAHRVVGHEAIEVVVSEILARATRDRVFMSPNGRNAEFWVRNVVWDVRESMQALRNANLIALDAYVASLGGSIAPDQRENLYTKLLVRAKTAADAPYDPDPAVKKLSRVALLDYVRDQIREAQQPSMAHGGTRLRHKMMLAGLPEPTIESAWELRQRYRAAALSSKFLALDERDFIEGEVQATLNELLSKLHANELDDTSYQFHSRCIQALRDMRQGRLAHVPLSVLQGVMYDITERCGHQFSRFTAGDLPSIGDEAA